MVNHMCMRTDVIAIYIAYDQVPEENYMVVHAFKYILCHYICMIECLQMLPRITVV